jgi:hypothetical protein
MGASPFLISSSSASFGFERCAHAHANGCMHIIGRRGDPLTAPRNKAWAAHVHVHADRLCAVSVKHQLFRKFKFPHAVTQQHNATTSTAATASPVTTVAASPSLSSASSPSSSSSCTSQSAPPSTLWSSLGSRLRYFRSTLDAPFSWSGPAQTPLCCGCASENQQMVYPWLAVKATVCTAFPQVETQRIGAFACTLVPSTVKGIAWTHMSSACQFFQRATAHIVSFFYSFVYLYIFKFLSLFCAA